MSTISRFTTIWKHIRFPWRARAYVGSDPLGNEYYESTRRVNNRTKRIVELRVQKDLIDYNGNEIPVQWESWLRHTRYDPPTIEEIVTANKRRDLIIERAKKLDQEYKERKTHGQLKDQQNQSEVEEIGNKKPIAHEFSFKPPTIPGDNFEPETWNPIPKKK